jgi:uncharacterized protein (DUF1684 family)
LRRCGGLSWLLAGGLAIVACGPAAARPPAEHRAEIEKWRARRLESLRKEDGWLSLVGLFWLEHGENRVGSDPSNRVVLPDGKAPRLLCWIDLAGERASVRVAPGGRVTHEGKPIHRLALSSDADGGPTVLRHGTLRFFLIRRGPRLGVRVKDSESEARRNFRGIESFPVDPAWRVAARFEPYDPPRPIAVPNVLGSPTSEISPGAVVFRAMGRTHRLDAVTETGSEELFLIFGDRTNGEETYGGGRFLYAPRPDASGRVVVDFNKAYNPPCVFTPYATCPLPPPQNKLPIRIEAGEKTYGEH